MSTAQEIRVGDPAPAFEMPASNGETVKLSDFLGRSEVVLFFYPKDNTPGCTMEACSFRDSYEAFKDAGAVVIGVSSDSNESHQKFADRHRLPYPLLSDADGRLRARFGVPRTFGLFPGRVTYLIDKRGIVRHVFSSQLQPAKHVEEALRVLKEIQSES
jgi:thioredoxin-dependent peroxiredoxin